MRNGQIKAAVIAGILAVGLLGSMAQVKVTRSWAYGLFVDGTATLPSISFASDPTVGLSKSASGIYFDSAGINQQRFVNSSVVVNSNGTVGWSTAADLTSPDTTVGRGAAAGVAFLAGTGGTSGIRFQFNAAPAVGTCGTSPSVTAGSTDSSGEVNVGTGGTATSCGITFATTWASAPRCIANVNTATAGNTRSMGATTTTTTATFTAASAFAASDKVWWICIGSK